MALFADKFLPSVHEIETFYVLDLDRCLADSDKLHQVLEEVVARQTSITVKEVNDARFAVEQRGETFNTAKYIHGALSNSGATVSWPQIVQQFIKEAQKQDMLEPYARELLAILDKKQLPYGIITYGIESWQLAKLEACNLMNVPHEVTAIKEKGELLRGWKHERDFFAIPPALHSTPDGLIASTVIFVDDKAVSFQDIPEGVRGIRVRQLNRPQLASQLGPLPDDVLDVEGLLNVIGILFPDEYRKIIDKA